MRTILSTVMAMVLGASVTYAAVILLTVDQDYEPQSDFKFSIPAHLRPQSSATVVTEASRPIEGKVKLLHKIDVSQFGAWCGLRLGDLDGDNRLDVVLAQNVGQSKKRGHH